MIGLSHYLIISAALFSLGILCVLTRRNAVNVLMGIELILNAANLNLIDDAKPSPVPQGIWDQLKSAFVERRPYGHDPNVFTEHARASNELRLRLFRMAIEDEKRRKSAFMLLGQIEEWRLEYGRPPGEPRHPNIASGQLWPPKEP